MKTKLFSTCLLVLVLLGSSGCNKTLKDDAPSNAVINNDLLDSTFVDENGLNVDLKKYRGKKIVLVVLRGLPVSNGTFCPYCIAQASSLSANRQEFEKRNTEVVIVYPGSSEKANEFTQKVKQQLAQKDSKQYGMLMDKDCTACDKLGIRGDMAKPSTFIINEEGNVIYAYVGKNTTDRPSVKAVLKVLDTK